MTNGSAVKIVRMNSDDEVFDSAPPSDHPDSPDGAGVPPSARCRFASRSSVTSSVSSVSLADDMHDDLPDILFVACRLDVAAMEALFARDTPAAARATSRATSRHERTAAHLMLMTYSTLSGVDQLEARPKLVAMIKLLADAGLDLNDADRAGQKALHLAASLPKQGDVIRALLANGARIDDANGSQQTALLRAAAVGDLTNMQVLLQVGANVNAADSNGQTVLHMVCKGLNVQKTLKLYYDLNLSNLEIFCSRHLLGCYCHPDYVCYLV